MRDLAAAAETKGWMCSERALRHLVHAARGLDLVQVTADKGLDGVWRMRVRREAEMGRVLEVMRAAQRRPSESGALRQARVIEREQRKARQLRVMRSRILGVAA